MGINLKFTDLTAAHIMVARTFTKEMLDEYLIGKVHDEKIVLSWSYSGLAIY